MGGGTLRVIRPWQCAGGGELVTRLGDRAGEPAAGLTAGGHLDLNQVAGDDHRGPGRRAGQDHVARLQRGQPGDVGHDVGQGEQQVLPADRVLPQLAVDPGTEPDVSGSTVRASSSSGPRGV